jgi:hypothetical protein
MKMTKIALISLLALFYFTPSTWAHDNTPSQAVDDIQIHPNCTASREICIKRAKREKALEERCAADPNWCERRRAWKKQLQEERRILRERCKVEGPNRCEGLKRAFKEKQAQRRKEKREKLKQAQEQWCKDKPNHCEPWKRELKALNEECRKKREQLDEKYRRPRPDGF